MRSGAAVAGPAAQGDAARAAAAGGAGAAQATAVDAGKARAKRLRSRAGLEDAHYKDLKALLKCSFTPASVKAYIKREKKQPGSGDQSTLVPLPRDMRFNGNIVRMSWEGGGGDSHPLVIVRGGDVNGGAQSYVNAIRSQNKGYLMSACSDEFRKIVQEAVDGSGNLFNSEHAKRLYQIFAFNEKVR